MTWILPAISMALGAGGTLASLFGSDPVEDIYRKQAQGIDPAILADMRRRARSSIGNQSNALRVNAMQNLTRQNAPIAKQQEVMDQVNTRGLGAIGDTLGNIDQMNEQYKMQAMNQLAGYLGQQQQGLGQGFASLFGAGLQGLLMNNFSGGGKQQGQFLNPIGSQPYSRLR